MTPGPRPDPDTRPDTRPGPRPGPRALPVPSILVVCTGNICRSPAGERLLAAALPGIRVGSAGLGAVVGAGADPETAAAAAERGLSLAGHVARQFTAALARDYALILVMEPGQRDEIRRLYPQLSGRTMMFDQWTGGRGIADPHGRPQGAHRQALAAIAEAADAWVARLGGTAKDGPADAAPQQQDAGPPHDKQ